MSRDRFACVDCGCDTFAVGDYYRVHDSVWLAGGAPDGMICVPCLEARLGRPLTADDFPADVFINRPEGTLFPRSDRLAARLAA